MTHTDLARWASCMALAPTTHTSLRPIYVEISDKLMAAALPEDFAEYQKLIERYFELLKKIQERQS